jgi:type IV pilus assembly protein PilY1
MNSPSFWRQPKRVVASTVAASLLMQVWMPVAAAVSQSPAVYTAQPDANVMFTLDDSGSMAADVIPDLLTNDAPTYNLLAKYPQMWSSGSAYLNALYYEDGITGSDARFLRSSASNPIYYDPRVTYTPWPDPTSDKLLTLPAADYTKVKIHKTDPRAAAENTINLGVQMAGTSGNKNKFWPATYYLYKGSVAYNVKAGEAAAQNTSANFTKVEIQPSGGPYNLVTGHQRTDCGATSCTADQELKNFANWLQYYRNRMLMAKGGIAKAFAAQGTNLRVGLATINSGVLAADGSKNAGVFQFQYPERANFYTTLYDRALSTYTPLRKSLDTVGKYFSVTAGASDAQRLPSPYAFTPYKTLSPEYDCRKNFNILSTDGYWNDAAASTEPAKDNDIFKGEKTPVAADGKTTYDYSDDAASKFQISPFADTSGSQSNTLADVAAYYWKNDLNPNLKNNLSPTVRDPAFWQHVTTFTVGLGITGTGTVAGLDDPVTRAALVTNRTAIDWPSITGDTPSTGDDLIRTSMVGRGRYFSATDPTTLANGLASALAEATDQPLSLAALAPASAGYFDGSKVYQGTFNPSQWYGRLYQFTQDAKGVISTASGDAKWEASNAMPLPAARKIFSYNPDKKVGSTFDFSTGGLTSTQQAAIDNSTDLLNYLRGDDAKEASKSGGIYRNRERYTVAGKVGGVLGDIVNSTPIIDTNTSVGYQRLPAKTPGAALYKAFRDKLQTELPEYAKTVFVGANDGMLHAFETDKGVERFAFVPNAVFSVPRSVGGATEKKLKLLSNQAYDHRFTVDGPPQLSDAFFGKDDATGSWRVVLNGTTGAGARSIFVTDVSKPEPSIAGGFGTGNILWEYSDATDSANMGYNLQYGHTALMANGQWALIFGNGYDSVDGQAVLYIRELYTGNEIATIKLGAKGIGNGLSQPNFVLKDRVAQTIYAGDLKGNLWKVDVSSDDKSKWGSAFVDSTKVATPLFTTPTNQPITVMPTLAFQHPNGGTMVTFGTGKLYETEDLSTDSNVNVNLTTQAIYGIWDKTGEKTGISGVTQLVQQSMNGGLAAATDKSLTGTTSLAVDWTTKRGWYLNLKDSKSGERVNVNPQLTNPSSKYSPVAVVANTPAASVPCQTGGSARVFYLDPYSGGAPAFGLVDANQDSSINSSDKGYNVWSVSTLVTQPVFQAAKSASTTGVGEAVDGRTGVRDGGREDIPTSGPGDCKKKATFGQSDTGTEDQYLNLCPALKGRITWRQIQ